MADLQIWWGSLEAHDAAGAIQPALAFDDDPARCVVEHLVDCSTAKLSQPVPKFTDGLTTGILLSENGPVWISVGDGSQTVAPNAPGSLLLLHRQATPIALAPGKIIAAIDHT